MSLCLTQSNHKRTNEQPNGGVRYVRFVRLVRLVRLVRVCSFCSVRASVRSFAFASARNKTIYAPICPDELLLPISSVVESLLRLVRLTAMPCLPKR